MKLNVKFIIITFVIVLTISITSTVIFYSLASNVISNQQSKSLLNSANDFIFSLQDELQLFEEDFQVVLPQTKNFETINLDSTSIDFIFTVENDSLISEKEFAKNKNAFVNYRANSIQKFFNDNPNILLRYERLNNGKTIFSGILISAEMLDRISEKIRAEVAFILNGTLYEISNSEKNQKFALNIIEAEKFLRYKNNFDIHTQELASEDFIAATYTPKSLIIPGGKVGFIIFNTYKDSFEFSDSLRSVMFLLILAGSAITILLVLISTVKLRKQLIQLSETAELTGKGDFTHRVMIESKDEIGMLGIAFNRMLDELEENKKAENEYTEFIQLINQSPSLSEISDAALKKITNSTRLAFGVLYLVEKFKLRLISSHGIGDEVEIPRKPSDIYASAVEKKEKIEFNFHENHPEIKIGITSIKIKYLLIYPLIYNKETVAVLELASESAPTVDVISYLNNIHEQLAIGLVNAKSLEQLENLVDELRKLNDDSQKQNEFISKQNFELKELHHQIAEKAKELEKQTQKAVELSKVKSEFLASMSHELRTPLISILGLTELLINEMEEKSSAKDRLRIVYRNGKKLLGLITNILEFSKFESGQIAIHKEAFLLDELIKDVSDTIKQIAVEKNLEFIVTGINSKNYLVETDRTKLEQILLNLLINAVKFTDAGSIAFQIIESDDGLTFSILDTGIGISTDNQKIIFDEFIQADGSSTRKFGGAGLGLAICKKYVNLLGGNIQVNSEIGQGSNFLFTIPNIILERLYINPSVESKGNGNAQPLKILVINKNEESRKFISDYLFTHNYETKYLSNYGDLIAQLEKEKYQAIILDPFYPSINIWETIALIKSNPPTRDIPVILTVLIEDERVGWEPKIYDFITSGDGLNRIEEIAKSFLNESREKLRIALFGDDNTFLQKNDNRYEVKLFHNFSEFISIYENKRYDLAVIDIQILGNKFLDVVYKISTNKNLKMFPVIVKLPSSFENKVVDSLNAKLYELTIKFKYHPLDMLKVLRDRLNLERVNNKAEDNLLEIKQDPHLAQNDNLLSSAKQVKPKILVVDDDNDALYTIGEMLKKIDCDTIFAHNGLECLLILNQLEPDLILLDIMMPQMDGFETIKRIRENKNHKNLPVIALTAYAMLENKIVIEKNGFDDLITKPLDSTLFFAKIKSQINRKTITE
jgi:signal transduction histidine kinase/CheY-like chemotaxis protein